VTVPLANPVAAVVLSWTLNRLLGLFAYCLLVGDEG
jgi:hypothetical protein